MKNFSWYRIPENSGGMFPIRALKMTNRPVVKDHD